MKNKYKPSLILKCHGFTLIELLVVIAIILILMGLLSGAGLFATQKAKIQKAKTECLNLLTAVKMFRGETGIYPDTIDSSNLGVKLSRDDVYGTTSSATKVFGPYYEFKETNSVASGSIREAVDPWGIPYVYYYPGQAVPPTSSDVSAEGLQAFTNGFVIVFSLGPDGTLATPDDIGSWQ